MEGLQNRVETWIIDQSKRIPKVSWAQLRWPPWKNGREERKMLQEEYARRKKQLQDLCHAVKADSVGDLQDILCSMTLSECVYKRPGTEIVRVMNKFKADFGGQVVSLERVEPSLDHVSHRYLLAEAGDTLFVSFIGTKQYKDLIVDANILQGSIFHDEIAEDIVEDEIIESKQVEDQNKKIKFLGNSFQTKSNQLKPKPKPAAHRGFLARAKGIPALELYRLAQKKNRKLVLCGHSLGGAVAALATLAILRVMTASSLAKESEKVQVKCITFSQPPVGNAALRDYVHEKGWGQHFRTYCIPEDLVPRILSPAYFHHYNAQPSQMAGYAETITRASLPVSQIPKERSRGVKSEENEGDQLVLGLGPVQNSFWRLSKLVPLQGVQKQLSSFMGKNIEQRDISSATNAGPPSTIDEVEAAPQFLEIQEGSDGISLKPFSNIDEGEPDDLKSGLVSESSTTVSVDSKGWRRVPYLPSYVPFGQLYLLGNSSVESLSEAEYSKLTSVKSVITELKERFQSHSMRSYRSRFQKIYDLCMCGGLSSSFLEVEQLPQFRHLQQWLGLSVAGAIELGHIVDRPVIHTATSIIPLGWSDVASEKKNGDPLKVDITGYGLHLCTLVQAQVNGNWCSTTVESLPPPPSPVYPLNGLQPELQKMRILVGAPLRFQAKHQIVTDSLTGFPSMDTEFVNPGTKYFLDSFRVGGGGICPDGLNDLIIFCTSDFTTVSKEVCVRTRRVRLVGIEGAGKTSLYNAILGRARLTSTMIADSMQKEPENQEGIAGGLCFSDTAGVNLQDLNLEVARFRDGLSMGVHDLKWRTDLIVLVHNLSHKIPRIYQSNTSQAQPALLLFLNEAKALGIPWVLAITNKFSVSAHLQKAAVNSVLQAYEASPTNAEVINSCPYVTYSATTSSQSWDATDDGDSKGTQKFSFTPINFVRRPFQKKTTILPVEGVTALCQLIHRVLRDNEELSFEDLARDRLLLEMARDEAMVANASRDSQEKGNSMTASAVGASLGAGLGIVLAVVMGAASALRKP